MLRIGILLLSLLLLAGCKDSHPWNSPYRKDLSQQNILFNAFSEQPKTLDPAKSYSADSALFVGQIVEPLLQYHYLLRPYRLVPLATTQLPEVTYFDAQGQPTNKPADIATTRYRLTLRNDLRYAPHPALAARPDGSPRYRPIQAGDIKHVTQLSDFSQTGSRTVTAADYAYQIKRLASPKVNSPIYSLMAKHIQGLPELHARLQAAIDQQPELATSAHFLDLRNYPLSGVKVIDATHLQITLLGNYPQFRYWLAMPFFAPTPWEADAFYSQPGMSERNLGFDWAPIGSGPYQLSINDPNRAMMLVRNPNFHHETYPTEGMPEDKAAGLLKAAGQQLPFIDAFLFSLEKESIPRWHKFLQGYYDSSGISSDNFDQAIQLQPDGSAQLSPAMQAQHLQLRTSLAPSVYYLGFNMLDPVVGGYSDQARALRQAIAIAVNYQEFIRIFLNGRGKIAHSPIPPQIWQAQAPTNPITHTSPQQRRPLKAAQTLMNQAGYPQGIDPQTGHHLVLHYDITGSNGPDDKARFDWLRKQFNKIGIELDIRATQYNRFQDKLRTGNIQLYGLGWNADYPDPENFLFLFYGHNGKVKFHGENASNYANPKFDRLFEQMRDLPPGKARDHLIEQMVEILREDAPWLWGYHPLSFILGHQWIHSFKLSGLGNANFKYFQVDPAQRVHHQQQWNQPIIWPLLAILTAVALLLLPAWLGYRRRQRSPTVKRYQ